jgi:hypothetical protein
MKICWTFAPILMLAGAQAGCSSDPTRGYSFVSAYDAPDDPRAIRTVAVPVFENTTFSAGAEVLLTDAIVKEILRVTPWAIASGASADATLKGAIAGARLRKLNTDSTSGFVSEQAVDLRVDFDWVDNRSGETILARRDFRAVGSFAPGNGAREPIELGEQDAIERLARDIVHELLADW